VFKKSIQFVKPDLNIMSMWGLRVISLIDASMLTLLLSTLFVSCGCFFSHVDSISCYKCDALDSPKSDCPGWNRRAVNSIMDLHDRGGLYTHCVDVRLANGTVLHQDVVPALPMCKSSFIQTWRSDLMKRYSQHVSIMCCEWSRCNGPNAGAMALGPSGPYGSSLLGPSLILPVILIAVIFPMSSIQTNIFNISISTGFTPYTQECCIKKSTNHRTSNVESRSELLEGQQR